MAHTLDMKCPKATDSQNHSHRYYYHHHERQPGWFEFISAPASHSSLTIVAIIFGISAFGVLTSFDTHVTSNIITTTTTAAFFIFSFTTFVFLFIRLCDKKLNTPTFVSFTGDQLVQMIGIKVILDTLSGHRYQTPLTSNSRRKRRRVDEPADGKDGGEGGREALVFDGEVIGFVSLSEPNDPREYNLISFRDALRREILNIPSSYRFMSKERWPVAESQESSLLVKHLINSDNVIHIQRTFEKPRYGIVTTSHLPLGFIFVDSAATATALDVREAIKVQLDIQRFCDDFIILDKNGWPIAKNQETVLMILDLTRLSIITIETNCNLGLGSHKDNGSSESLISTAHDGDSPTKSLKLTETDAVSEWSLQETSKLVDKEYTEGFDRLETSLSASYKGGQPISAVSSKPILISYVRQEAEQHARRLKSRLTDLGCNVFLDVDEIVGGHDWQDTLNNAVVNCGIFVPLITPQYGLTIWTNREVKLADMKNKLIIPVSFLDHWPPECLAIQFASTQYLMWKTTDEIESNIHSQGSRAQDIRYWDEPFVQRVAEEICAIKQRINTSLTKTDLNFSVPMNGSVLVTEDISKDKFEYRSTSIRCHSSSTEEEKLVPDVEPKIEAVSRDLVYNSFKGHGPLLSPSKNITMQKNQTNPLIVISANPEQREFVELLRVQLVAQGYQVWSSTDMCTCETFVIKEDPDTLVTTPSTPVYHSMPSFQLPAKAPTLSDSHVFDVKDSQTSLSEDSFTKPRLCRPTFLPMRSQSNDVWFSQLSELSSQNSVFTPEDMDKAKTFRAQANKARLVLMILSEAYCRSKTCKSQAFYSDYRKTIIAAKYEECTVPDWLQRVLGTDIVERESTDVLSSEEADQRLADEITLKVQNAVFTPKEFFSFKMTNAKIESLCHHLYKRLSLNDRTHIPVFLAGGSKFYNPKSEEICCAVGKILSEKENIILVTSGCFGVAEAVGRSFAENSEHTSKTSFRRNNLFHILPRRDDDCLRMKCRQKDDGTCEPLPFGETIFVGDSMHERNMVVGRVFNFCILIEGGPATARLAREFVWNDNIVIPVISTGGAASGKYNFETSTTERPACVNESDWEYLQRRDVTSEEVALAIVQIVFSVCKSRPKFTFAQQKKSFSHGFGHSRHPWKLKKRSEKNSAADTK